MKRTFEHLQERNEELAESLEHIRHQIRSTKRNLERLISGENNLIEEIESNNKVLIELGEKPRVVLEQ